MASDGSLLFDSKLDNSDFEKALKQLLSTVEEFIQASGSGLGKFEQAMAEAGAAAEDAADKAGKSFQDIDNAVDAAAENAKKLENAVKIDTKPTEKLADSLNEVEESAKKAAPKLEETGKKAKKGSEGIGTLQIAFANLVSKGIEKALSALKDFL